MLSNIGDLSTEVLVDILGYLGHIDLGKCQRVAARFHTIVNKTPSLRYSLELGAAGYREGPSKGSTNVIERLDTFRKIQRIWRNPNVAGRVARIPIKLPILPGSWARFPSSTIFRADILLIRLPVNGHLAVVRLDPNAHEDNRARIHTFPSELTIFDTDPGQNLLLIYHLHSRRLHFMSLRDGKPHPRAGYEGIQVISDDMGANQDARAIPRTISVVGDWLLVHIQGTGPGIRLYHWPSAELRMTWSSTEATVYNSVYLADGYVLLSGTQTGTPNTAIIEVHSFVGIQEGRNVEAEFSAVFKFPSLRPDRRQLYYIERRTPSPMSPRPFYPSGTLVEILLTHSCRLFTPLTTFISETVIGHSAESGPLEFPWEIWGPRRTRIHHDTWIHPIVVSGMRVIMRDRIWDFNEYDISTNIYGPAVPPGRSLRNSRQTSGTIHREPTRFPQTVSQASTAETFLPYRETLLPWPKGNADFTFFIEDDDGPKMGQIVFARNNEPRRIELYPLQ